MTVSKWFGPPAKVAFRTVLATLSAEDEVEFSALLAAELPLFRCYDQPSWRARRAERPPGITLHRSIADCAERMIEFCFVNDDWQPNWLHDSSDNSWVKNATQAPNGIFHRSDRPKPPKVSDAGTMYQSMGGGDFYFRCRDGVEEDFRIANKTLRMLRRYCTNKLMPVHFPSLRRLGVFKNNNRWVGPHALAWARAAPNRILGLAGSLAYVPLD